MRLERGARQNPRVQPPAAKRIPTVIARPHGQEVVNPYEWLRDPADPDVLTYLHAENAYADAAMTGTEALQTRLAREVASRRTAGHEPVAAPIERGRYRFTKMAGEGDFPVVHRAAAETPEDPGTPVLDLNEVGRGRTYLATGTLAPSDDGEYLAWTVDLLGNERFTLAVTDLRSGRIAVSGLAKAESVTWAGNETLFYVEVAKQPWRGQRLWRIDLPEGERTLVLEEHDRSLYLEARRSSDGRNVLVDVLQMWSGGPRSAIEVHAVAADLPRDPLWVILDRSAALEVHLDTLGDELVARVDDRGPYCRIVRAPLGPFHPEAATTEELLPHRDGVGLDDLVLFAGHAVVGEREDGLLHIRVIDLQAGSSERLPLPEPACSIELDAAGSGFEVGILRYRYSSFVTPPTAVELDLATRASKVVWRVRAPGHDPARYEVFRLDAVANDGARIPVFGFRSRGAVEPAPTVLQGYGCYGYANPPDFKADRFSLVDRGATWAVALVRGGGELGRAWHDAGRQFQKRNTFTDFIAAAEQLIATGVAEAGRVAIKGASAGGTLVLAVANLRPELFCAVSAGVPFADPLHVQLDDTMPFTILERAEWGDPYRSLEEYDYLAGYCPYTNVEAKDYPAMFVTASLHDGQVPYWQPAKYVARRRSVKSDDKPLLLRTNLEAGHLGSTRPGDAAQNLAFEYAFLIRQLGLHDEQIGRQEVTRRSPAQPV